MQVQSNVDVQANLKSLIEKSVNSSDFLELESYLVTLLNEDKSDSHSNVGRKNFIGQWVHLQQVLPTNIQTLLLMFEFGINGNLITSTNSDGYTILHAIISNFQIEELFRNGTFDLHNVIKFILQKSPESYCKPLNNRFPDCTPVKTASKIYGNIFGILWTAMREVGIEPSDECFIELLVENMQETGTYLGEEVIEIMLEDYVCKGDLCLLSRGYLFEKCSIDVQEMLLKSAVPMFEDNKKYILRTDVMVEMLEEKSEEESYEGLLYDEMIRTPLEYILSSVSCQPDLVRFSV